MFDKDKNENIEIKKTSSALIHAALLENESREMIEGEMIAYDNISNRSLNY
jgi:hypothetical protein